MLKIERTNDFKRDFKRELRGRYSATVDEDLRQAVAYLVQGQPLPRNYQDHNALGEWKHHRECHLKPDLLLIYKTTETAVILSRIGSHTRLFKKL